MKELRLSTGRRLVLEADAFCECPREWDNKVTTLIGLNNSKVGFDVEYDNKRLLFEAKDEAIKEGNFVFELYMLNHSGIKLSLDDFNDPWDSGLVGFVIVKKDDFMNNENRARALAEGEIDYYNKWINGEVYSLQVEHPEGFDTVIDDRYAAFFIDSEDDLEYVIRELDLTNGELHEALDNIDKLY